VRETSVTVTTIHPRFEAGISFIGTSRFTATVTRFVPFPAWRHSQIFHNDWERYEPSSLSLV